MAVALPDTTYQKATLESVSNHSTNRLRGGAVLSTGLAQDYWALTMLTAPMGRKEAGLWDAFVLQHAHGKSSILMGDPIQCLLMSYSTLQDVDVAGGGQFSGVGDMFSITDLMTINVHNLPSHFSLKAGDRIGVEEDERATIHMITDDATATGSGQVDLKVMPPIPKQRTVAAKVRFDKPVGEFILERVSRQQVGRHTAFELFATSRVG